MTEQNEVLQSYIEVSPAHHEFQERWPVQGLMTVRIGLADEAPPAHVASSVLAIVLDDQRRVLFLWPAQRSGNISHLLVGGRPKPGESAEATATREVGEETGWQVETAELIGYRHFHQLEPRKKDSDRPYPDFIQQIHVAKALRFDKELLISSDRIPSEFLDYETAIKATDVKHRPLLHAAGAAARRTWALGF